MEQNITVTFAESQAHEISLALVWLSVTPENLSEERRQALLEICSKLPARFTPSFLGGPANPNPTQNETKQIPVRSCDRYNP